MKSKSSLSLIISLLITFSVNLTVIAADKQSDKDFSPKPASASLYNLGLKSFENNDLDSAITYFKKAIELDPEFIDAYFNLGAIYKKKKDHLNAIAAFQKTVSLDPSDLEAKFELANACFLEKDYKLAQKYFLEIPNSYPKYKEVKDNLDKIQNYIAMQESSHITNPLNNQMGEKAQAQLLVDKLTEEVKKESNGENIEEVSDKKNNEQIANSLTKPSEDSINIFKVLSKNFSGPTGIAKDSKGNIYIANFKNDVIEIISPDGTKRIFYDESGINGPVGLAVDEFDNLYVANYKDGSVVKISQDRSIRKLVSDLDKPYYLLYDHNTRRLLITAQGNNSLIEISTTLNQPISFR